MMPVSVARSPAEGRYQNLRSERSHDRHDIGQHGVALEVGHLVLAGSFTRIVHARKGDTLHADFGSLGGIAVQFV